MLTKHFFAFLHDEHVVADWGGYAADKTERQVAPVIDGEDWDREAHVGHLFNEEELRQLNG